MRPARAVETGPNRLQLSDSAITESNRLSTLLKVTNARGHSYPRMLRPLSPNQQRISSTAWPFTCKHLCGNC